jgi:hypothetical protein
LFIIENSIRCKDIINKKINYIKFKTLKLGLTLVIWYLCSLVVFPFCLIIFILDKINDYFIANKANDANDLNKQDSLDRAEVDKLLCEREREIIKARDDEYYASLKESDNKVTESIAS